MTARSGTSSSSSSVATASIPPTTSAVACTTLTRPLNDSRRWSRIRRPGDVSSRSAPITTTCEGSTIERSDRTAARQSRRSAWSCSRSSAVRSSWTHTTPSSNQCRCTSPTDSNTPSIALFPGKGVGHQVTEPGGPGDQRQILQQHRRHALVVVGVGDGEGDLGLDPAWAGVVLADADDRTVGLGDQRDLLVDVLDGGSPQLVIGDEGPEPEEPGVRGRVVELLVEGPQPLDITGTARRAHEPPGPSPAGRHARTARAATTWSPAFVRRHLPDHARRRHPPCSDIASQPPWTAHRSGQWSRRHGPSFDVPSATSSWNDNR